MPREPIYQQSQYQRIVEQCEALVRRDSDRAHSIAELSDLIGVEYKIMAFRTIRGATPYGALRVLRLTHRR
jgi:hypothetical protein